ncbi:MAG: hypothetical protein IIA53_04475 [Chloroflexi bacterium]|nr:hypothetical protein [Chloroflexota bacterium]
MQAYQLSNRWRAAVLLVAGILALFALAACGGDDKDAPAAGGTTPTEVPAPTAVPAPTIAPTPAPPAAPMVPATVPEPGSDEEKVMAVLETQVRAVNAREYALFQETCTPNATSSMTVAQLKHLFEERRGATGADKVNIINFSPEGYHVANVEVRLLRAPFAQAIFDVYDDDILRGNVTRTFEKVEGQWYSESLPCGQG